MPRQKLSRRFEPRYGVNQAMVNAEVKWLERELEDQLLGSMNDLKRKLSELHTKVATAEEGLQAMLDKIPDRERLALKCMLARDVYHISILYQTFLRSSQPVQTATGGVTEIPEEAGPQGEPRPGLFRELLFE